MRNLISVLDTFFSYHTIELDKPVSGLCFHNKRQLNDCFAYLGYWCYLGSSEDFAGQTLANCVEVIHSDIVGVWNLPDNDRVYLFFSPSWLSCAQGDQYLSSTAFKAEISYLIQDLSRSTGNPSRWAQRTASYIIIKLSNALISCRPRPNGTRGTGAAWLNERYEYR